MFSFQRINFAQKNLSIPILKHLFLEYHFPYVIGLLSQTGSIEVRATRIASSFDSTLVQQIKEIKGKFLVVNQDNIYVASSSQVWKLIPLPVQDQIQQLLSSRQFEDAIFMCENLSPQERVFLVFGFC